MKVVYVAGSYRAANPWLVEQNIRRAEQAGLDVALGGVVAPLVPHAMTRFYNGTISDAFWLRATLALLERCDAVVVVGEDWESSSGTVGEIARAAERGIPVFYDNDAWHAANLPDWQDYCAWALGEADSGPAVV